jgi:hypothetical protein
MKKLASKHNLLGACYLKMEMKHFSETSLDFQQTEGRYIQKDRNPQALNACIVHLMLTDLTF